jgi:hypothetical protein
MSDTATFNLVILVAIAFRWSLNPLGRERWILESPTGKTFVVGCTNDGMPEITEELREAIAASSGEKTGVHPAMVQ